MKSEKLFRCPACGKTITEETWLEDMDSGGTGYCMCDYSTVDPISLVVSFTRVLHEYDVYHLSNTTVREVE